jgi:hypothetical protein
VRVGPGERIDGQVISVDGPIRVSGVVDGHVLAVNGRVTVDGEVSGTVTSLDGDVVVNGRVGEDVTATSGQAIVGADGFVGGDVRSSERPQVATGARVEGDVSKTNFAGWFTLAGWLLLLLWWFAVTVTLLIAGLLFVALFPRAARAVAEVGRESPGLSAGWGALLGLALPLAAGAFAATVVGLPLGLGILLMLVVAFPFGYLMTALIIGRLLARRMSDVPAFLIGFVILRGVALVPGLGWLIGFLAAAYGVGALAVAAWRAGREAPQAPDAPEAQELTPSTG